MHWNLSHNEDPAVIVAERDEARSGLPREREHRTGSHRRLCVAVVLALVPALTLAAAMPVPVSPGSLKGALIGTTCPTFSWGGVPGAESYELVVYRIAGRQGEPEAIVRQRLPASTYAWTPSLDRCLEQGEKYAWSVRSFRRREAGDWSPASLFRVAAATIRRSLDM